MRLVGFITPAWGEALRRLDLMRESKAWRAARRLPRHTDQAVERASREVGAGLKAQNKARTDAFKNVSAKYQFNAASIQKFGEHCRDA
jgi:putative transposase